MKGRKTWNLEILGVRQVGEWSNFATKVNWIFQSGVVLKVVGQLRKGLEIRLWKGDIVVLQHPCLGLSKQALL